MILDGYWKRDLYQIRAGLLFWCKMGFSALSEHRINRGMLYSAAIIRKIAEDEKEAEHAAENNQMTMPPLQIIKTSVPVKRYRHTDSDKFFVNSKMFLNDYDMQHAETDQLSLFQICNQIIHSYTWAVVHQGQKIHGVLFASDREKEKDVFYLTLEDWISTIQTVIDNSVI